MCIQALGMWFKARGPRETFGSSGMWCLRMWDLNIAAAAAAAYSRCQTFQVSKCFPAPGALNSRMHTALKRNYGFTMA